MCFPFERAAQSHGYSWCLDKEQPKYDTIGLPPDIKDEDHFVEVVSSSEGRDCDSKTESSGSSYSDSDSTDKLADEFQSMLG